MLGWRVTTTRDVWLRSLLDDDVPSGVARSLGNAFFAMHAKTLFAIRLGRWFARYLRLLAFAFFVFFRNGASRRCRLRIDRSCTTRPLTLGAIRIDVAVLSRVDEVESFAAKFVALFLLELVRTAEQRNRGNENDRSEPQYARGHFGLQS